MARILIFSDDRRIFDLLGHLLRQEGHPSRVMYASEATMKRVKSFVPDLVMIDSIGREDAIAKLIERIRYERALKRMRLIVFGKQSGATGRAERLGFIDRRMARPIDPREVLQCVKSPLHRSSSPQLEKSPPAIKSGELVINPVAYTVERSRKPIPVTTLEFRLLYFLASRPNQVCKRDQMLGLVWDDTAVRLRAVDVAICHLRKKLGMSPGTIGIQSARSLGYVWKTS